MNRINVSSSLDLLPETVAYLMVIAAENNVTLDEMLAQILDESVVASMAIDKHIAEQEAAKDSYEMNVEKQVEEQLSS
jgi:hypothetical protein